MDRHAAALLMASMVGHNKLTDRS